MTSGGKSIELIVDHLCCGLGPGLNLAVGPDFVFGTKSYLPTWLLWNRSRTAEFGVQGVHEYGGC